MEKVTGQLVMRDSMKWIVFLSENRRAGTEGLLDKDTVDNTMSAPSIDAVSNILLSFLIFTIVSLLLPHNEKHRGAQLMQNVRRERSAASVGKSSIHPFALSGPINAALLFESAQSRWIRT